MELLLEFIVHWLFVLPVFIIFLLAFGYDALKPKEGGRDERSITRK